MSWFSNLTGIEPESPQSVRQFLKLEGTTLISTINARRFDVGTLTTPSLSDLRLGDTPDRGPVSVQELIADAQTLHTLPANAGATFQVASQFNLLEMVGPTITPEHGVGGYETDLTQGPACAIACGAGTIYRNYFVPVGTGIGQTESMQIDCLTDVGKALNNDSNLYWIMQNGYALPTKDGLDRLNTILSSMSEIDKNSLRGRLRIGVHSDTEVTFQNAGHKVTQLYCSAMPVSYGSGPISSWTEISQLVLEAAYEATLLAAVENSAKTGNNRVFLTLLGGGAFGNKPEWIVDAILRALRLVSRSGLDINLVSFGASNPTARLIVNRWASNQL
ncbi:MAG: hypothetical protein ABJH45_21650 [Paracoccaceae bacterium]